MDFSILVPGIFTALTAVLGYFIRRLVTAHDKLQKDFDAETRRLQEEITRVRVEYLRSEEFSRFESNIDFKLTKIYDILVTQR